MQSLYLLIPLSLVFVGLAIAVFFWAVNSGQYDDLERESERILFDDDETSAPKPNNPITNNPITNNPLSNNPQANKNAGDQNKAGINRD